ncbi:MAG TPA: hypothetical protein VN851_23485 [Thermoanaerobaculia bacterium]|nr:hypothetical protein [Thermoanaerobaculia bacterium]
MPSPRGDGLYALLCPRGSGANPRLRFNSRDLAEAGTDRPLGWSARPASATAGFWPLAGADLSLVIPSAIRPAQTPGIALETDLEADLASVGLGPQCLAPRLGGAADLAAAGLGARLRLPSGTLGAWSASGWQRLRTGWLFRGDAAGGCAFLLAEIAADSLEIEDLEGGRQLRLAPHVRQMLELEIEPAESAPAFAVAERELAGVG